MKLVVGLGNPGRKYALTRHNAGFAVVKKLAKRCNLSFNERFAFSLCAKGIDDRGGLILALPLTFMNLSGKAVGELLDKFDVGVGDMLVVCDDVNLPLGTLRIRPCGSAGGHNGLKSIISTLGRDDFSRLRIGVGRPQEQDVDLAEYVLSPFTKKEKLIFSQVVDDACDCCLLWLKEGVGCAMDNFNKRRQVYE